MIEMIAPVSGEIYSTVGSTLRVTILNSSEISVIKRF